MAKSSDYTTETAHVAKHDDHGPGFLTPDLTMVGLTWITFLLLLAVLYKTAWKPILAALDKREKDLRDSIENADKIKAEMEALAETTQKRLDEADQKAKEIIAESRKAAGEAAKHIEAKAKEEAQILLENAQREIKDAHAKAEADLRSQSAQIAVDLAEKLIEENMSDKKNREFVDKLLKDM